VGPPRALQLLNASGDSDPAGAERMVVGHSIQVDGVDDACDGQVLG
jgi:hypothetical protein